MVVAPDPDPSHHAPVRPPRQGPAYADGGPKARAVASRSQPMRSPHAANEAVDDDAFGQGLPFDPRGRRGPIDRTSVPAGTDAGRTASPPAVIGAGTGKSGPGRVASARPVLTDEERGILIAAPDFRGGNRSTEQIDDRVLVHRNLTYAEGDRRDAVRHRLDVYLPTGGARQVLDDGVGGAGSGAAPAIVWFHGGGWQVGSKDDMGGLYGRIGAALARQGIAFVNANYRLTPRVRHPGHVEDVAAAVAYVVAQADQFNIRPDRLFVAGHSAGAHLASLLATQPDWLAEYDLDPRRDLAGVIALGGVYDLKAFRDHVARRGGIAGALARFYDDDAANADSAPPEPSPADAPVEPSPADAPVPARPGPASDGSAASSADGDGAARTRRSEPAGRIKPRPGMSLARNGWDNPFPPGSLSDASPLHNIRPGIPPFLIVHEGLGDLIPQQAVALAQSLERAGVGHERVEIACEDHFTILLETLRPGSRVLEAMVRFVMMARAQ